MASQSPSDRRGGLTFRGRTSGASFSEALGTSLQHTIGCLLEHLLGWRVRHMLREIPALAAQGELHACMAKTLRVLFCLFSSWEGIKQSKNLCINSLTFDCGIVCSIHATRRCCFGGAPLGRLAPHPPGRIVVRHCPPTGCESAGRAPVGTTGPPARSGRAALYPAPGSPAQTGSRPTGSTSASAGTRRRGPRICHCRLDHATRRRPASAALWRSL